MDPKHNTAIVFLLINAKEISGNVCVTVREMYIKNIKFNI